MTALVPFRPPETLVSQADTDSQLLDLWLHGRGPAIHRAYERDSGRFLAFVGKPVRQIKLADVQAYADSLDGLAPATRARAIAVGSHCWASLIASGMFSSTSRGRSRFPRRRTRGPSASFPRQPCSE
jgi:hypothetical protein